MAGEKPEARKLLTKLAQKEEMQMAEALLNTMSRDQQEWENQMGYERFVHDCISREKYAFMKGEKKRAFETARKMLSDGMAVEIVAKYSGLTVDEVKVL